MTRRLLESAEKILLILGMLYVTADLTSDMVTFKMVSVFHVTEIGAVFIFPLTYLIADIVTELYGYSVGRTLIWVSLCCDFLFVLLAMLIIHLPSPDLLNNTDALKQVIDPLLRVDIGGALGILIGGFANIYALSKWKVLFKGRYFWLRSIASTGVGEAVYIIVACLISYSSFMTTQDIFKLMLVNYATKIVYAIVGGLPAAYLVKYLKEKIKIDTYDTNISYNPFNVLSIEGESNEKR